MSLPEILILCSLGVLVAVVWFSLIRAGARGGG
jgi:hypothetical protein